MAEGEGQNESADGTQIFQLVGPIGNLHMSPYDSSKCSWKVYAQVFKNKMKVHDIKETKWPQYLLTFVGFEIVTLLTELCFPEEVENKGFNELLKMVQEHLEPDHSEIAETYKFMARSQKENESITEYVAALKSLAKTCNFGNYLDRALRDKFVHGLCNQTIIRRLFTETQLTFQDAVKTAKAMELAENESQMVAGKSSEREVHAVNNYLVCHCCGRRGHAKPRCRFRENECNKCKKRGHLAAVCKIRENEVQDKNEKVKKMKSKKKDKGRKIKEVEAVTESSDEDGSSVLKVGYDEFQADGEEFMLRGLFEDEEEYSKVLQSDDDNIKQITKLDEKKPEPWEVTLNINGKDIVFEMDCGADVTLMPERYVKNYLQDLQLSKCSLKLTAYGGVPIEVLGKVQVNVVSKGKNYVAPLIIVKGGKKPLLGRDWLNVIKIDWPLVKPELHSRNIKVVEIKDDAKQKLQLLLGKYSNLFSETPGEIKGPLGKLNLKPNTTPIKCKPRRIPYALEKVVKLELDKLVETGKMSKVSNENITWATPIVPIVKNKDSVRICGDYKVTINPVLEVPSHPIPVIDDIFAKLNNGNEPVKVFSKIDLRKAYMNLKMDEDSQNMLTLTTPWGFYRPNFMMFGIAPAPLDWQRFMDTHFLNIPHVYCYLDDILIANTDISSHLKTLNLVLGKIEELNIKINKEKTEFMSNKLQYCGYVLDKTGLRKLPDHVKAILDAPQPKNVKQLRSFLGTINFYNKFMCRAAEKLHVLYQLLRKDTPWNWNEHHSKAFEWAKNCMSSDQVLTHYNPNLPLVLSCDASGYGLGACLAHKFPCEDNKNKIVERPIAFASRTLTDTERKYSQIDKEALSIIWAVKKFDLYLKGGTFTLITDHKPLISLFNPNKAVGNIYADRMARWALILSNYNYKIQYRTSQHNASADFPSRLPIPISVHDHTDSDENVPTVNSIFVDIPPITQDEVAKATQTDSLFNKLYAYIEQGWPKKVQPQLLVYKGKEQELYVVKGVIMWRGRTVIPTKLRKRLLLELHIGHLGLFKMKSLAKSYFWWPNINSDIESITQNCKGCLQVRNKPQIKPLHSWEWPNKCWQRIHADFAGPFLGSMWLIVIDAHSKWPEIARLSKTTAEITIKCLRNIFTRFGLPEQIVTDNGPQWTSEEFKIFCKNNNIRHICTAPYHPASNGQAERGVQSFKKALLASKFDKGDTDQRLLSWLLSYRTARHVSTGKAPCELMFGRQLRTRISLIKDSCTLPKQDLSKKQVRQFLPDDTVQVAMYDGEQKWLEGKVLEPIGNVMYKVQTSKGNLTRNVTQMLPINTNTNVDVTPESSNKNSTVTTTNTNSDTIQPQAIVLRRSARAPKPRKILDL